MNNDQVKSSQWIPTGFLLLVCNWALAQNDPPIDNNIVCYAAQKQWVCAPADEQDKALQKAKDLAISNDITDDNIEINTIEPVDIGQQVKEQPVAESLQYPVSDFVARKDAIVAKENTSETTTESESSEPIVSSVVHETPDTSNSPLNVQANNPNINQWREQFAGHWTYQVIGTTNRHKLDQFIVKHGLDLNNLTIVKTQNNGADWWIVLTGLYPNRSTALDERYQLPAELAEGAWLRQVRSIVGEPD